MVLQAARRWLTPAPDSAAADSLRCGRSPWMHAVHLLWSAWLFITPSFGGPGYTPTWFALTALSFPIFLALYAGSVLHSRRLATSHALGMVALCLALLSWYPSGLSYFVFGCVMLHIGDRVPLWKYLLHVLALNVVLAAACWMIGYPWQVMAWMLPLTLVIGTIVNIEGANEQKDAALRLSQDEVRRLAATAERERIGRDLHDLLGHTLSVVALKSELAGRLIATDPAAARVQVGEVETVARQALAQVREAVAGIRATGLQAELAAARLALLSAEIPLDQRLAPMELDPTAESVLAMGLREAVTNILRHAGASRVDVELAVIDGEPVLSIVDDGRGGIDRSGHGLDGMRERLAGVGGRLEVDSPADGGTRLRLVLPPPARLEAPR